MAVVNHGVEAVGARKGAIWFVDEAAGLLRQARAHPSGSTVSEEPAVVPVDADGPVSAAYRTRAPYFLESQRELEHRHPEFARRTPGIAALACLPLVVSDRVVAVVTFVFETERIFDANERALC